MNNLRSSTNIKWLSLSHCIRKLLFCNSVIFTAIYIYIYIYITGPIGIIVRVFANGSGYRGSIQGRVIPKSQKWYLMLPRLTLCIKRYGSRGKRGNPGQRCSNYWKRAFESLSTAGAKFTSLYIYIYIYIYMYVYIYIYINWSTLHKIQNSSKTNKNDYNSQTTEVWNTRVQSKYYNMIRVKGKRKNCKKMKEFATQSFT